MKSLKRRPAAGLTQAGQDVPWARAHDSRQHNDFPGQHPGHKGCQEKNFVLGQKVHLLR